jgi:hypothetical protein
VLVVLLDQSIGGGIPELFSISKVHSLVFGTNDYIMLLFQNSYARIQPNIAVIWFRNCDKLLVS